MKKILLVTCLLTALYACNRPQEADRPAPFNKETENKHVANLLDSLNAKAAQANFDQYFSLYAENAIFAGTDATERWEKTAFMTWAKPYFDKGKAWSFTSLERNIYFNESGDLGWFDELLSTQMKICRGSGVVVKENGTWKIKQYILSMTVPNEQLDPVLTLKAPAEDALIKKLSGTTGAVDGKTN